MKNQCSPNNNLVLTKDKVFQLCDSDDEVEMKDIIFESLFHPLVTS